jgi:hypothetical protein
MKPGSWWEKPLWSCLQTRDVSREFSVAEKDGLLLIRLAAL